jgi:enoyl-CoA hydratase/carnithine racemase
VEGVRLTLQGGVARLTLDRPRQGNRIDLAAAQALVAAAEAIELDDSVRILVLEAAGRAFCLGAEGEEKWGGRIDWVAAIGGLSVPVLGVLQGDAVGEGCELALACDLRLIARGARMQLPQVVEGRLPAHGATQRLPRLIGRSRALDLLLSGRAVTAREAVQIGLATRAVAAAALRAAVQDMVADLVGRGPIALRLAKEAVNKGADLSFEQGVRLEQDLYVLLQTTRDRHEGVRAFLQKRRPRFRGA